MRQLIPIIVLLLTGSLSTAQPFFNNYSIKEGLSQQDVNSFFIDKKGFYWIGTNDGLNRFDGNSFKKYSLSDGLNPANANLVGRICSDQHGRLWVATHGDGLKCFDPISEKITHFRYRKQSEKSIRSNRIHSTFIDKNNQLWIYTSEGIDITDLNQSNTSRQFIHYYFLDKYANNASSAVFNEDLDGNIWFFGRNKLLQIPINEPHKFKDHFSQFNVTLKVLAYDNNKYIIAAETGIYTYDLSHEKPEIHLVKELSEVKAAVFNPDSTKIWVLANEGIVCLSEKISPEGYIETFTPNKNIPVPNGIFKGLYIDKQQVIWLPCSKNGISKLNPNDIIFNQLTANESGIRHVAQDSYNKTWVGTSTEGLFRIINEQLPNLSNIQLKTPLTAPVTISAISVLQYKGSEEIWVGTELKGIYRYRLNKTGQITNTYHYHAEEEKKHGLTNNYICQIHQDKTGTIWVASYLGGLLQVIESNDPDSLFFRAFKQSNKQPNSLKSNTVRSILSDHNNLLYVGTSNGLQIKTHGKNEFQNINLSTNKSKPETTYIQAIHQSSDGTMWFGTIGSGLIRKTTDNQITHYTVNNGNLPNNTVKSIIEDSLQQLWLGTNIGIVQFSIQNNTFELHDKSNGLLSYEYDDLSAVKLKNNQLFFGSAQGANIFLPASLKQTEVDSLSVYITHFSVFDKELLPADLLHQPDSTPKSILYTNSILLAPNQSSFTIEFTALNTKKQKNLTFSYKLIGFDKEWTTLPVGKRNASYTNIPSGEYIFEVRTTHHNNHNKYSHKSINITIKTPLHLSKTTFIIYFLVLALLIYFFQKYTIIHQKEKNKLVFENYKHEQTEEFHQIKMQYFTNITHQFRTPLSLIYAPIELLVQNKISHDPKVNSHLNTIHNNSKYLLRLVNHLLEFNKLEQNKSTLKIAQFDIVPFIKSIVQTFQGVATTKGIELEFKHSQAPIDIWLDIEKIEMILYNLITNSIKYTNKGGKIEISINNQHTNDLTILVRDNGIGISNSDQPKIFDRFYQANPSFASLQGSGIGLYFAKRMVEMHAGKIECESQIGIGTTMKITFKKDKTHFLPEQVVGILGNMPIPKPLFDSIQPTTQNNNDIATNKTEKLSIIIADDDDEFRNFLQAELAQTYKIYAVNNGKEAFRLIKEAQPDLIISDVIMPEMNGYNLCLQTRKNIETSHIPIILLSGATEEMAKIEGLRNGADDYISKPFSLEYLYLKIGHLLENKNTIRNTIHKEVTQVFNNQKLNTIDEELFLKIKQLLDLNLMNGDISVNWLSDQLQMSRSLLFIKMKAIANLGPNEFIRNYRLSKAAELLNDNNLQIKEVMYKVGFSSSSYFSKCFKNVYGCSPREYLQKKK